jgi:hypothetical protein
MQPLRHHIVALLFVAGLPSWQSLLAADASGRRPLRVCLVSGSQDSKTYSTDDSLAALDHIAVPLSRQAKWLCARAPRP